MWRRSVASLAIYIALVLPASASAMRTFTVGNWFGGAYANNLTHTFDHCAASASYHSGILMAFIIDRNFRWSMRFADPAWHLQTGQRFRIAFTVDNMTPIIATALATSSTMVEVALADSVQLFSRFRHGYILRVAAANQVFGFSLNGTSRLLPVLLTCARDRGTVTHMAANPFVNKSGGTGTNSVEQAKESAEATAFAANLLSLAGVKGFAFLGPDQYPQIKGQARWLEGATFGSVNIIPAATDAQLKNLASYLIGRDARLCKGAFLSGAIPDEGTGVIARVFTTCQIKGKTKPVTAYYLAVPRKTGGVYIIETVSIGSEQPAKEADTMLRDAVLKISSRPASSAQN